MRVRYGFQVAQVMLVQLAAIATLAAGVNLDKCLVQDLPI
jgi:hypothetical protein